MAEQYILSIDQGTTSTRAILFNHDGVAIAQEQRELPQIFREPGWVEHDANIIWDDTRQLLNEVVLKANIEPYKVGGIGITNQRETTVLWDRLTAEPIAPAIVWQSKQSDEIAEQLKAEHEQLIYDKTGLWVDAYFSATKIMWLLQHTPGAMEKAERGDILFGTIDSWLLYKMTDGAVHATDYTNASRTMLFNIHTLEWDDELLELFGIPKAMLPKVEDSAHVFGHTANYVFFGLHVPISGIAGDQQAALVGHRAFNQGSVKNTYGTGSFIVMNTGKQIARSNNGLLSTIAYSLNGEVTYALEGSVFIAGAAIQWLRDGLELIKDASETSELATLSRVQHPDFIYMVPAFTGLGAPYWDQQTRGAIFGITRATNKADIVRATLESLAYQTRDVLMAMENDIALEMDVLVVDGGVSVNDYLQQFQADLLQLPVRRPDQLETTALGAAFLAGLGIGFWSDLDDLPELPSNHIKMPDTALAGEMEQTYGRWKKAVRAAQSFPLQDDFS
ncbi:glycerol kinase [Weissella uvarum]|uniref:glycerol kinase GlpK n=1 Tax=Weissella uvarum TaxID=1479233 RepID=UPI0019608F1E|nr:glycerol kinase GlpK [Weissella uvarum]MBM7617745.1 glycerol kinase [Weissella uvarum]MCM0595876.1 glycerol kinase GlpK [Weissella uvarum]